MTDPTAALADALRDRYALERELGRGGMATVWLARDLKHDRPVALKVLHSDLASTLGADRFQREIKLAARLQHPHILSVYDSGASAGHLWFTMPYVEGESLRDRLRRGALPVGQALRIARQTAQALEYAHQHGVIHRDVKPENILLTPDGNTLVADFGIARPFGPAAEPGLTTVGLVVGTPGYMSPEQALGEADLDGRSDVYSLGCVLYEMLTGGPPFVGPTGPAIMAKQVSTPAPHLPSRDDVPPGLARAIDTALAKDPAGRYATAAEFAEALRPVSPTGSRVGWRTMAAVGAALLLLLGLTYYSGRRASLKAAARGGTLASGFNRKLAQVTFGPGLEEWPAWAPDGARLAYAGEADGFKQLVLRTVATGEERALSHEPKDHIQPTWSPDGKRIAFVRAKTERGKLEPSDLRGWFFEGGDIWTLDPASGAQAKVVDDAFDPAYSPDGTRLAFDAERAGPRRIWITDSSGHNPRQITSDSSEAVAHTEPRWSPDGTRLAFRRIEKTKSQIVVVDLASQAMIRMTSGSSTNMDPAWSPDDRYLYFASDRGGGLNLWRVPVGATGPAGPPEQLTTGAGDDVEPTVAGGGKVAFAVRGINSDVWRLPVSPETGKPTGAPMALVATTREESRAAWSPDGSHIAFNSDRLGEMNLWVRQVAGSDERQLTSGPGGDYQPSWAPDGNTIAFFSARGGNPDIWTVRVADGRVSQLTQNPATDINPFYSPDGRQIAFLSDRTGRGEVWLMNADGSDQRQLTSSGASGHFLRWTQDGRSLVYRGEAGGQLQIYRVSVADKASTRLPDVSSGAHMSFSPDQSRILDVRGHKTLWIYPVNGDSAYQVFAFPDPDVRIDYPVWSPDGKWVLFDRAAPKGGDLWMMEGVQ
ncbi:MAG TPA: protein kinase [Gemmatimonadales bacterium]